MQQQHSLPGLDCLATGNLIDASCLVTTLVAVVIILEPISCSPLVPKPVQPNHYKDIMAPTAKYAPLHRSSPDSDTQNGPWLKRGLRQVSKSPVTRTRSEIAAIIAGLLLVLSATANILLGIQLAKTTTQCTLGPSPNIGM